MPYLQLESWASLSPLQRRLLSVLPSWNMSLRAGALLSERHWTSEVEESEETGCLHGFSIKSVSQIHMQVELRQLAGHRRTCEYRILHRRVVLQSVRGPLQRLHGSCHGLAQSQ